MKFISTLFLFLSFTVSSTMAAQEAATGSPKPGAPLTTDELAQQMTDFTRNADVLKDPKKFVPFVSTATEPSFAFSMANQMLEPGKWAEMTNSIMNPASYSDWMPLATDPDVYAKWMAAGMDGNFYTAMISQLADPAKLMRWMKRLRISMQRFSGIAPRLRKPYNCWIPYLGSHAKRRKSSCRKLAPI